MVMSSKSVWWLRNKWAASGTSWKNHEVTCAPSEDLDQPGHCSYTMMDNNSKKIVSLLTLDKRRTARKSGNLKKLGFQNTLTELRRKGCAISEVVADVHMQISSIMSEACISYKPFLKTFAVNISHSIHKWLSDVIQPCIFIVCLWLLKLCEIQWLWNAQSIFKYTYS